MIRYLWYATVRAVIPRSAATSFIDRPAARRFSTSRSRAESRSGARSARGGGGSELGIAAGDLRAERRLAAQRRPERRLERLRRRVLQDVGGRAGGEGLGRELRVLDPGQEHDRDAGQLAAQPPRRVEAARARHARVEQDQVGPHAQRDATASSPSEAVPTTSKLGASRRLERLEQQRVVFGDDDARSRRLGKGSGTPGGSRAGLPGRQPRLEDCTSSRPAVDPEARRPRAAAARSCRRAPSRAGRPSGSGTKPRPESVTRSDDAVTAAAERHVDPRGTAVADRVLERLLHHAVEHERRLARHAVRPGVARHLDRDAVRRRQLGREAAGGRQQAELVEARGMELVGDPVQVGRERAGLVGERLWPAAGRARSPAAPAAGRRRRAGRARSGCAPPPGR